jgi:hypothetical protein
MLRSAVFVRIVTIVALILLVISGVLIVDRGIPALQNVAVPMTVVPITHAPETRIPLQPTGTNIGVTAAQAIHTTSPAVLAQGAGQFPTLLPPACPDRIAADNQLLFDAANNALAQASSHRFSYDGTLNVQMGQESAAFELSGAGFSATLPDSTIHFQVDTDGAFTVPVLQNGTPVPTRMAFAVPLRTDSRDLYFAIRVPERNVDTPMFVISFQNMLNAATGGTFGGVLGSVPLDPSTLSGFDIDVLEDVPGFFQLFDFGQYICTTRLADTANGQGHFTSTIAVIPFLGSSQFAGAIDGLFALNPESAAELGFAPGAGAALAPSVAQFVTAIAPDLTIEINHFVDLTNRRIARVTLDVRATIANVNPNTGSMAPAHIRLQGTINYSNFNEPQTLDIPPNPVRITTLDEVQAYVPTPMGQ